VVDIAYQVVGFSTGHHQPEFEKNGHDTDFIEMSNEPSVTN
jgi:hypothetical protein